MLRLSKKVEYGIIAAQFLASKKDEMASAKEISDELGLSFDFMSKTLQAMLRKGVLISQQGTHGGYRLAKSPEQISLSEIIYSLNEKPALVECFNDDNEVCSIYENCSLRNPINILQKKIDDLFGATFISELIVEKKSTKINITMDKVKHA